MPGLLSRRNSGARAGDVTPAAPAYLRLAPGLERVKSLVGHRFGPILELRRQRLGGPQPPWWLCTGRLSRYPIGSLYNESPPTSAGTSLDIDEATARAVGEALERYSGLNVVLEHIEASLEEGGFAGRWPVCAPDELCPSSYRLPPHNTPLTHVRAERLSNAAGVVVPASFVCLAFRPEPPELPITLPISTGLAFHTQLHRAIWNGFCEVVERDAVMSMWWIHRSVPEIDLATAPNDVCIRVDLLNDHGITPHLYDITTELEFPTVFCILEAKLYPNIVVSAATRASAAASCSRALDEAVSMRVALLARALESDLQKKATQIQIAEKPVTLHDHARWYADGDRDGAFDFLLHSDKEVMPYQRYKERSIPEPADMTSLRGLAHRLEADNVSVLWTDVTVPEVSDIGFAVRVIVPELVPMSMPDDIRWLGTERLLRRASVSIPTKSAFTRHPHPFA